MDEVEEHIKRGERQGSGRTPIKREEELSEEKVHTHGAITNSHGFCVMLGVVFRRSDIQDKAAAAAAAEKAAGGSPLKKNGKKISVIFWLARITCI